MSEFHIRCKKHGIILRGDPNYGDFLSKKIRHEVDEHCHELGLPMYEIWEDVQPQQAGGKDEQNI